MPEPEEVYVPPRFWWLKRISLGVLVVFLLLAIIHQVELYRNKHALNRLVEAARAKGEPVYVEDFNRDRGIPDDENAAILYQSAAESFTWPAELASSLVLDDFMKPGFLTEHLPEAAVILQANAKALALLRQARDRPQVDWNIRFTSPMAKVLSPRMTKYRTLARLLYLAVHMRARQGNHAEAVAALTDGIKLFDGLEAMPGSIAHLVSLTTVRLLLLTVEDCAPHMQVAGSPHRIAEGINPVPPKALFGLIRRLLDDRPAVKGWKGAWLTERALAMDELDLMEAGKGDDVIEWGGSGVNGFVERLIAKPFWYANAREAFRYYTIRLRLSTETNYPTALRGLPRVSRYGSPLHDKLYPFTSILLTRLIRARESHYRSLALRRLTATALAIRWYASENSQRPERLGELVPKYLPAVPQDPFALDGRAIGYLPENDPPLLYSVNVNGIDEQGAFGLYKDGRVDDNVKDLVFFLNGDRPRDD